MCLFFLALMWSAILNIILKMNIFQARHLPIITEYFIDQEKYFYLILLIFVEYLVLPGMQKYNNRKIYKYFIL
jgi:hypothetical protein